MSQTSDRPTNIKKDINNIPHLSWILKWNFLDKAAHISRISVGKAVSHITRSFVVPLPSEMR